MAELAALNTLVAKGTRAKAKPRKLAIGTSGYVGSIRWGSRLFRVVSSRLYKTFCIKSN